MEISRVRKIFFILTWVIVSWISQFSKLIRWSSSDLCILLYINLPPKIAWVRSYHSLIHSLLMALLSIQSKSQRPFSGLKISAWTTPPPPQSALHSVISLTLSLALPIVTSLQLHYPLWCCLKILDTHLCQGICTGCSLHLECCSLRYSSHHLLHLFKVFAHLSSSQ